MLKVTDTALEHLAGALEKVDEPKPEDACFRIVPQEDGTQLGLTLDKPTPEDTEYAHAGDTVLVLAPALQEHCDGRTLDADESGNLMLK